jgi:hypothetical protein
MRKSEEEEERLPPMGSPPPCQQPCPRLEMCVELHINYACYSGPTASASQGQSRRRK